MKSEKAVLELTHDELLDIQSSLEIASHKEYLEIRKVRRNRELIQKRYDEMPKEIQMDHSTPDEIIESCKYRKAYLDNLTKKIKLERKQLVKKILRGEQC